jgi:hypothetical protein
MIEREEEQEHSWQRLQISMKIVCVATVVVAFMLGISVTPLLVFAMTTIAHVKTLARSIGRTIIL